MLTPSPQHLPLPHKPPLNIQYGNSLLNNQILKYFLAYLGQRLYLLIILVPLFLGLHLDDEFESLGILEGDLLEGGLLLVGGDTTAVFDVEPGEDLLHGACAVHVVLWLEVGFTPFDHYFIVVRLD